MCWSREGLWECYGRGRGWREGRASRAVFMVVIVFLLSCGGVLVSGCDGYWECLFRNFS